MNKIAKVYASSLFELAVEEKIDVELRDNLKGLCAPFERDSELVQFLSAPMFTLEEKTAVLDEIFKDEVNVYLLNFFKVMTEKNAAMYIKEAMETYVDVYNDRYEIEKVTATTAIKLTKDMTDRLTERLEKLSGKTIILENVVDSAVIGGIIINFRDTELNASIANKLKNIKEELSKI